MDQENCLVGKRLIECRAQNGDLKSVRSLLLSKSRRSFESTHRKNRWENHRYVVLVCREVEFSICGEEILGVGGWWEMRK